MQVPDQAATLAQSSRVLASSRIRLVNSFRELQLQGSLDLRTGINYSISVPALILDNLLRLYAPSLPSSQSGDRCAMGLAMLIPLSWPSDMEPLSMVVRHQFCRRQLQLADFPSFCSPTASGRLVECQHHDSKQPIQFRAVLA